jgi:hypothetical protein
MSKKDWMSDKLKMLTELCKTTEPDEPSDSNLFTPHNIEAASLAMKIQENFDEMTKRELLDIMVQANHIWKVRKMVENGEVDDIPEAQLINEVEDMLLQNYKIQAIKHYRAKAKEVFGAEKGLRESKDAIDYIQARMKVEGKLK